MRGVHSLNAWEPHQGISYPVTKPCGFETLSKVIIVRTEPYNRCIVGLDKSISQLQTNSQVWCESSHKFPMMFTSCLKGLFLMTYLSNIRPLSKGLNQKWTGHRAVLANARLTGSSLAQRAGLKMVVVLVQNCHYLANNGGLKGRELWEPWGKIRAVC